MANDLAYHTKDSGRSAPYIYTGALPTDTVELLDQIEELRYDNRDNDDSIYLARERYDGTRNQHHKKFLAQARLLTPRQTPEWEPQWSAPFIMSSVETISALTAGTVNSFFGIPVSGDADDRQSAGGATRLARYLYYVEDLRRKRWKAARYGLIDGGVYYKVIWDDAAQRCRFVIVPAWEVLVSRYAEDLDQARILIHERVEHIDTVRMMWADRRGASLGSLIPDSTMIPWEIQRRYESIQGSDNFDATRALAGCVVYREVYERPTKKRPQGRFRVLANDRLIHDSDYSKQKGLPFAAADVEFPFVYRPYIQRPGQYHGLGLPTIMWPSVRYIEMLVNQHLHHNARIVHPTWWLDKQLENDPLPSDEPGGARFYDSMSMRPPFVYTPAPMSTEFLAFTQFLINLLGELVGAPSSSHAQAYKRAETATAVAIANEVDKNRSSAWYVDLDDTERRAMWMGMKMTRAYGPDEMIMQIVGRGRVAEVNSLKRAQLWGVQDLYVNSAASLSDNKHLRFEQLRMLKAEGALSLDEFRYQVDMPAPEDQMEDKWAKNKQVAENNLELLKQGVIPEMEPGWVPQVHIDVMEYFMLDASYAELDPTTKQICRDYYNTLKVIWADKAVFDGQVAMMQGGGMKPGGGGGGKSGSNMMGMPGTGGSDDGEPTRDDVSQQNSTGSNQKLTRGGSRATQSGVDGNPSGFGG